MVTCVHTCTLMGGGVLQQALFPSRHDGLRWASLNNVCGCVC